MEKSAVIALYGLQRSESLSYLDHGEETRTGETRGALKLFGGVELILKILLGDGSIIGEG